MKTIKRIMQEYLDFCCSQKRLDAKTIRAYEIDLTQFITYINAKDLSDVTSELIEKYLKKLHSKYKPKTVKRKIASLKAFFRYADFHELVPENPWNRVQCYLREPVTIIILNVSGLQEFVHLVQIKQDVQTMFVHIVH